MTSGAPGDRARERAGVPASPVRARRPWRDLAGRAATAVGIVAGWEALVRLLGITSAVLPAPSAIAAEMLELHTAILSAAAYTMSSAVQGYAAALVVGVLLAIVFAHSGTLQRGLFPFFVASQAVPVIAFSAVVILWLGNGPLSKIAIAFYLSFFPITVSAVKGLQSADPMSVALLRTFGGGSWQVLWKIRIPTMLPFLFVALRVATTTALIGAIVGEWFGDNNGIGTLILQALHSEDTVRLWSGIVACAAMGTVFYAAVGVVERRLLWWPAPALES
ncbi:MAG: ABC transporter permease [Candidatus Rokubacteria bacterium]|nr:ABC transporter permease [Candidatus Rokubacteria bacterium]